MSFGTCYFVHMHSFHPKPHNILKSKNTHCWLRELLINPCFSFTTVLSVFSVFRFRDWVDQEPSTQARPGEPGVWQGVFWSHVGGWLVGRIRMEQTSNQTSTELLYPSSSQSITLLHRGKYPPWLILEFTDNKCHYVFPYWNKSGRQKSTINVESLVTVYNQLRLIRPPQNTGSLSNYPTWWIKSTF